MAVISFAAGLEASRPRGEQVIRELRGL